MAISRLFHAIPVRAEYGIRTVSRITCAECGAVNDIPTSGGGKSLPSEPLMKMWRRRSWQIGKTPTTDRCPDCMAALAKKNKAAPLLITPPTASHLMVVPATKPAPADAPREMTREMKRKIIQSIEDHWREPGGGYVGDMTDAEMARLLNIPRKWIEDVREEIFGPVRDNEAIQELLDRLAAVENKNAGLESAVTRCMEEFSKQTNEIRDLRKSADFISKKVA